MQQILSKLVNVGEFKVTEINQVAIVGPMKWFVLVLGPKHTNRDLKAL